MKVLHIVSCPLHSGAGRGVLALHEALLLRGIESRIIGRVENDLPSELNTEAVSLRQKLFVSLANRLYLWRLRQRFEGELRNFHPVSYGLGLQKNKAYLEADIIHIQFAGASTLGPSFWYAIKKETRPVIWTLRDMWIFTGGCHFSGECDRYITGCGVCPQLGSPANEKVTVNDLAFKADQITDSMTFIGISSNIAKQARDSLVLKERDIRVIPNSVMLDRFRLVNKLKARTALGLPDNSLILATGAISLDDPRKGSKTLQFLLDIYGKGTQVHWLIFGNGLEQLIEPVPENCTAFGSVKDDTLLNKIYAAADIFLMPSLQESFGKVTIEAMASGTPVIAYDNTPAEDMIINGATGWLVPHGNSKAFLTMVEKARSVEREKLTIMGEHAREDILDRFSLDKVVNRHIELYQEQLERSKKISS